MHVKTLTGCSAKAALLWLRRPALALAQLCVTALAVSLATALAASLAGCSASRAPVDLNLVFVEVTPMDYARILCQLEPMAERHTCMTSVVGHYREHRNRDIAPMEAIDGPFVAFIDKQRYRGSYVSNPFAAAFSVSNGKAICRGRYNAFAGDAEAVFRLRCDDGREGRAQIVLDQTGRNGIGKLWMASGSTGDIVFGYAAVGGAF
ncbi:hypothetical protein CKO42_13370 [Lamprobacter modestohalophilus]|uniref:Uncharacterized protein n=1 Tax=Lamprobacter modestohalophilus TaxID=1064514 RepID=A0A9X1B580_9GAMM|nr:hypothetical protein [Lamprobacter modestohalophilus]